MNNMQNDNNVSLGYVGTWKKYRHLNSAVLIALGLLLVGLESIPLVLYIPLVVLCADLLSVCGMIHRFRQNHSPEERPARRQNFIKDVSSRTGISERWFFMVDNLSDYNISAGIILSFIVALVLICAFFTHLLFLLST